MAAQVFHVKVLIKVLLRCHNTSNHVFKFSHNVHVGKWLSRLVTDESIALKRVSTLFLVLFVIDFILFRLSGAKWKKKITKDFTEQTDIVILRR